MTMPSRQILGMRVNSGTYDSAADQISEWALRAENRYVCVSNVHMTMETVDSDAFRKVVNGADMITSDGMPLVWMLRRLGLPQSERVYGPELVLRVCERAERERLSIGLYGGTDESLERFTQFLAERYPDLTVAYSYAPPFRPLTEEEDEEVVSDLAQSGARILFVGIGCPKQEKWMAAHKDRVAAVQIGVGAAFDFHSGAVKQAPGWMGRSGLEWLFRLMMEPKRLWKRYVLLNPRFMVRAAWQLLLHRLRPTVPQAAFLLLLLPLLGLNGPGSEGIDEPATPSARAVFVDQSHPQASDAGLGSLNRPFRTISAALSSGLLGPADTLRIKEGVYREELNPRAGGSGPNARLVIRSEPGHEVIITGADPISSPLMLEGGHWVLEGYQPLDHFGSDATYERDLVIANGRALRPVYSLLDLEAGTFFIESPDAGSSRLYIDTGSSTAPTIEMAQRGALFFPGNPYAACGDPEQPGAFHLIGLTFRHAANAAQFGAVCVGGQDSILEDVVVEETRGTGILVDGMRHRLIRVRSNWNGQTGINGKCTVCTVMDSETSYNNTVGHDPFWEAGGGKWQESGYVQFIRHTAIGNEGPGLWFDGNNAGISLAMGRFDDNLAAGVFIELYSEDVTVEQVTITGTRRLGWAGTGILIQAAGTATLRNNLITDNDGAGIWLRLDPRAEGGFNTIIGNQLESNGQAPDQDWADLQIEAATLIELCSNQLADNILGDMGRFYFSVDTTGEQYEATDLAQFICQVDYSDR